MNNKHSLVLLPNFLDEEKKNVHLLPQNIQETVASLDGLICESEKDGRAYLRQFVARDKSNSLPLYLLNEHTTDKDLKELLKVIKIKKRWGLISDCGLPTLADPGSSLVMLAHQNNIPVEAYMGPSSIILALMMSGLHSQQFSFHGYMPKEHVFFKKQLLLLERLSRKENITHIWIEAPYRSQKHFDKLLRIFRDTTTLCVAVDLTLKTEKVITKKIGEWKDTFINLDSKPAVFLINAR